MHEFTVEYEITIKGSVDLTAKDMDAATDKVMEDFGADHVRFIEKQYKGGADFDIDVTDAVQTDEDESVEEEEDEQS